MSRALTVARRDFENARRSHLLWGVVVALTLLVGIITVVPGLLDDDIPGELAIELIKLPSGLLVPIIAVIASYLAIAGEREAGQLNILLSLPPSRLDVVVGKFIGRSAVVLTAMLVAFTVGTIAAVPLYDGFPVAAYLVTMGLTGMLGLAFVGISVGLSAITTTRTRAMASAVGVVILFGTPIWEGLIGGINLVAERGFDTTLDPEIVDLVRFVSPSAAYGRLFNRIVGPELITENTAGAQIGEGVTAFGTVIPSVSDSPFYLQDWFILVMLAGWIVIPVVLGYLRFERADLS